MGYFDELKKDVIENTSVSVKTSVTPEVSVFSRLKSDNDKESGGNGLLSKLGIKTAVILRGNDGRVIYQTAEAKTKPVLAGALILLAAFILAVFVFGLINLLRLA